MVPELILQASSEGAFENEKIMFQCSADFGIFYLMTLENTETGYKQHCFSVIQSKWSHLKVETIVSIL